MDKVLSGLYFIYKAFRIKDNELLTIFKDHWGIWTTATRTPKENKRPKFKIRISGVRLLAMLYTKWNKE